MNKVAIKEMAGVITQYIRRKNKVIGLLMAAKTDDGDVVIEYSLCSPKDRFDKKLAHKIVVDRIQSANSQLERTLPRSIRKDYTEFVARCERYYKKPKTDMVGFI